MARIFGCLVTSNAELSSGHMHECLNGRLYLFLYYCGG